MVRYESEGKEYLDLRFAGLLWLCCVGQLGMDFEVDREIGKHVRPPNIVLGGRVRGLVGGEERNVRGRRQENNGS